MMEDDLILDISIHALLAESDLKTPCVRLSIDVFLSTLSLRRATVEIDGVSYDVWISIHALLAESDILGNVAVELPT